MQEIYFFGRSGFIIEQFFYFVKGVWNFMIQGLVKPGRKPAPTTQQKILACTSKPLTQFDLLDLCSE